MRTIELPETNGNLLNLVDYELDLLLSPPAIKENIIVKTDNLVSATNGKFKLKYNDTLIDEGRLKIFICDFTTGKYCIHIYGKIKGKEIQSVKEFRGDKNSSATIKNIRIKYILVHSRNILRTYYLSSDTRSIENHLTSFLSTL